MSDGRAEARPLGGSIFLSSFLVLFLEIALLRWLPAYIRLLSYFSNFILLACFLGIGVGCLLATSRRRLFLWFPMIQAVVVATVYFFLLEVNVNTSGSIYFSSGTSENIVLVESSMLLPLLFTVVAALFVTLAQQMAREMARLEALRAYTLNVAGSLTGVLAFAVISWLELSPTVWFAIGFAASVPFLLPKPTARQPWLVPIAGCALLITSLGLIHLLGRDALWSPYYKIGVRQIGEETIIDVNNTFHQ